MAKTPKEKAPAAAPVDAVKPGRPMFTPTEEQRRYVESMAAVGIPHTDIARVLKIDPKTLRLHFRDDLDLAGPRANAKVAGNLFWMATQRDFKAAAPAMFWAKTRMGWRETNRLEHSGPDGGPMQMMQLDPEKLKEMEPDELAALERAFGRLQQSVGDGQDGKAGEAGGD